MLKSHRSPKAAPISNKSVKHFGPGRPKKFNRDDALAGALHGFWKYGFDAMNAKALAEVMGIERSSFYNSFGSREKVFGEILPLYSAMAPDRTLAEIRPGDMVIPILSGVLREICRTRARDPDNRGCLMVNSIVTIMRSHPDLGPLIAGAVKRQTDIIEGVMVQAMRQGETPTVKDPVGAARAIMMFLIGLNMFARTGATEAQLWSACKAFLASLRSDPEE